jgi:hypothetical protein
MKYTLNGRLPTKKCRQVYDGTLEIIIRGPEIAERNCKLIYIKIEFLNRIDKKI